MAEQPSRELSIAETLLQRAHPSDAANSIFREHVKQRPLLLRPSSPDPKRDSRSERQYGRLQKEKATRKSKKPKSLSAKQKRALSIYDIPKEQQKYAIYEPLHRMWCGYIREILGLSVAGDEGKTSGRTYVEPVSAGPVLVSADYHGAVVGVVRSRCASRVGMKGIVVKDTKFTFEIVTRKDELKTIPKEHTVFQFSVPLKGNEASGETMGGIGDDTVQKPLVFEIHGGQFETRAPDRANKKFRLHLDPDL